MIEEWRDEWSLEEGPNPDAGADLEDRIDAAIRAARSDALKGAAEMVRATVSQFTDYMDYEAQAEFLAADIERMEGASQ